MKYSYKNITSIFLGLLLCVINVSSQARTLYWDALDVTHI